MDNILFINNPKASQYIYKNTNNPHGIYPQEFFTLTTEGPSTTETNYLDMHIHIIDTLKDQKIKNNLNNYSLEQLHQLAKKHSVSSCDNKPILIQKLHKQFNTYKPNFLNTNKTKIWNTNIYNKTDKFPIPSIIFPHNQSHTPQSIPI
jgi:hypothetical protein